jgi:excinuclease ABC subunit A
MDRPQAERIDGIPPAIAIDQVNSVRTSRSTVGTMTELSDHLKLLFARAARLFCSGCGREVRRDTPEGIWAALRNKPSAADARALICFDVDVPASLGLEPLKAMLAQQGYIRFLHEDADRLEVIQDRLSLSESNRGRALEALEAALEHGKGHLRVYPLDAERNAGEPWRFSRDLHCPDCDRHHREPIPSLFSFNSPVGACETCRGFGRTIGIDWNLVVPDARKSLLDGAIKPIQSDGYSEVQEDLIASAHRRGIPTDVPWEALSDTDRRWVLEGEPEPENSGRRWYGIRGFFDWLEGRSYKMHVRVLLSRYRSYDPCDACAGARLKDAALDYRIGDHAVADSVLARGDRFRHARATLPELAWLGLPGLNIHDLMRLPIASTRRFFDALLLPGTLDQALTLLLENIRTRLRYLDEVGLGYLTLERQSRSLSGGEVQRINLTTALGTALVNTLFVLDEPSIGLHPRDLGRVVGVLERLRDSGNSLLVVEHDPLVIRAADRLLEMGPGPGALGGEIVFEGPPEALAADPGSLTGAFLSGRRRVCAPHRPCPPEPGDAGLRVRGARAHNLQCVDLDLPLHRLVVVTGVSGSGKSTLVEQVLFNHLAKQKGHPEGPLGACDSVEGAELIQDVVMVDQSPIGRTSRSNPASFVGALDPLRKLFATAPLARERGLKAGHFSFNAGAGRCPTCSGSGFEHVEMQFLSDVYLRCPDCNGRRYRPEVLEVRLPADLLSGQAAESPTDSGDVARREDPDGALPAEGPNIADVLAMTVSEALEAFQAQRDIQRSLQPLADVGLGYLQLGQPVPTLSGGEAQRLKLAGHLAKAARRGRRRPKDGLLFLLDEPTTGLHFADIATLLAVFRRLIEAGHSLVVIEHNVDLMLAADWIVDLGPEGGDAGGQITAQGTPQVVAALAANHTGQALRQALAHLDAPDAVDRVAEASGPAQITNVQRQDEPGNSILVRHAREHNLKDLTLAINRDRFVVITGVSGSGKSTLAFDILFAEGQRRYLESLNAYARQFVQPAARADVDAVSGIPPTVAIEQRTSRGGFKSTVGTTTELHHFLRLLYMKLGIQHCPGCKVPIAPQGRRAILAQLVEAFDGREIMLSAPLVIARKGNYRELARWAQRHGATHLYVDGLPTNVDPWPTLDRFREHSIDLPFDPQQVDAANSSGLAASLDQALEIGKGLVRVSAIDGSGGTDALNAQTFSTQRTCPSCGTGFEEPDPRLFSYNSKHGWCPECFGTGRQLQGFDDEQSGEEERWQDNSDASRCPSCAGQRLRPEALAVSFRGRSIAELSALSIVDAQQFFEQLALNDREAAIATDLLNEIRARLDFIAQLGLSYLTLDRAAPTLSGGEAQRLRLAAQLGSNLRGVCYILDEPSIGLHARDNARLLDTLGALQRKGNSLIVVEHDAMTMRHADEIIDLGPGAGVNGGQVVARGNADALVANPASLTGRYLTRRGAAHQLAPTLPPPAKDAQQPQTLSLRGACLNNLRQLDIDIPLARLVCVTGVSGSGKSTLVRDVIGPSLSRLIAAGGSAPKRARERDLVGCKSLTGWAELTRVLEVDQTPIGKTPRSCAATYLGIWDRIRRLFAAAPDARMLGWGPGRFSFNTGAGRCPACEGQGVQRIEMSFLPDVKLPCEACGGTRFNAETRRIRYLGKDIGAVLGMSVDAALGLFEAHPTIRHPLQLLQSVGLGYLALGQASPTLSGGEAQRLKLVSELAKARPATAGAGVRPTLYLLDEPTVGLHMADTERLIGVLRQLVGFGHSVIVIEHDLDLIAAADWIIDLGPEGGPDGGQVLAQGPPEEIARGPSGPTATALRHHLCA